MAPSEDIEPGTEVEIRTRFTGEWAVGFGVVAVLDGGFKVRRLRDGAILPGVFADDEVRLCAQMEAEYAPRALRL